MQPIIEDYLFHHNQNKEIENEIYYYYVMEYAGLLTNEEGFIPVSEAEYNSHTFKLSNSFQEKNGYYYIKKPLPYDVSNEEFAAIIKTIPKDDHEMIKRKTTGKYYDDIASGSSGAATFFTIIAIVLFIGGFFVANSLAGKEFDHTIFWTTYIVYFISGCLCLCCSELFRKLQTIVTLLSKKR